MKPEYVIRSHLHIMEEILKTDETIQHTHKYPHIKGQVEALKWVLEDREQ